MIKRRSIIFAAGASLLAPAVATARQSRSNYEPVWWNATTGVSEWRQLGARPQRETATFAQFLAMPRVRRALSENPTTAAVRAAALGAEMGRVKREHPRGNVHLFQHQRFDIMGFAAPRGSQSGVASLATNVLLTASLDGVNTAGWVVNEYWSGGGVQAAEWAVCGNSTLDGHGSTLPCECVPRLGDFCPQS